MLSESYENVAVFHVPLKKEVHSQKSTEEISKDNIEEKKKNTPPLSAVVHSTRSETIWSGTASVRPESIKQKKFQDVRKPTQVGLCL